MTGLNGKRTLTPIDAAQYIEHVTTELRDLAARSGQPFLAYMIDMVRIEAASEAAQTRGRK